MLNAGCVLLQVDKRHAAAAAADVAAGGDAATYVRARGFVQTVFLYTYLRLVLLSHFCVISVIYTHIFLFNVHIRWQNFMHHYFLVQYVDSESVIARFSSKNANSSVVSHRQSATYRSAGAEFRASTCTVVCNQWQAPSRHLTVSKLVRSNFFNIKNAQCELCNLKLCMTLQPLWVPPGAQLCRSFT